MVRVLPRLAGAEREAQRLVGVVVEAVEPLQSLHRFCRHLHAAGAALDRQRERSVVPLPGQTRSHATDNCCNACACFSRWYLCTAIGCFPVQRGESASWHRLSQRTLPCCQLLGRLTRDEPQTLMNTLRPS